MDAKRRSRNHLEFHLDDERIVRLYGLEPIGREVSSTYRTALPPFKRLHQVFALVNPNSYGMSKALRGINHQLGAIRIHDRRQQNP